MSHPSIELFLQGLVFGAGFHVAAGVLSLLASVMTGRRPW